VGRSFGAGSPLYFKCPVLAKVWPRDSIDRDRHEWKPTGRFKPAKHNRGHGKGTRQEWFRIEYECKCGHIGWSTHMDMVRLFRRCFPNIELKRKDV
jgi:hypothetical protein